ncbi:MAG: hypothetical protein NTY90_04150 [Candidatus Micrarchaeota archaeon]|nr:hypothetical protein [Candidatus Micrarchaeota archaeon]
MPQNPELINGLRNLGLNQYEARAFHALTVFGSGTAGELSELAELPRPRVYDVLRGLQDKGFVVLKPGRPVKYASLPLVEALKTLRKQRESSLTNELKRIDEMGRSLQARLKPMQSEREAPEDLVWTLKSREAIYSKMSSMFSQAKDTVVITSTPEGVARKIKACSSELDKAKSRGVKIHVVSPTATSEISRLGVLHGKSLPTRFVLADDQALIFLSHDRTHPDDEIGIWLQSPHFAETLRRVATEKK